MPYETITNLADYDNLINKFPHIPIIMDFTATWCGPCKRISPVFEKLSDTTPNVVFAKVDVDIARDVAELFKINSMPTFVKVVNNVVISTFSGANVDKLNAMVNS